MVRKIVGLVADFGEAEALVGGSASAFEWANTPAETAAPVCIVQLANHYTAMCSCMYKSNGTAFYGNHNAYVVYASVAAVVVETENIAGLEIVPTDPRGDRGGDGGRLVGDGDSYGFVGNHTKARTVDTGKSGSATAVSGAFVLQGFVYEELCFGGFVCVEWGNGGDFALAVRGGSFATVGNSDYVGVAFAVAGSMVCGRLLGRSRWGRFGGCWGRSLGGSAWARARCWWG